MAPGGVPVGAITALFMGFLGIIQNDIKRVVAYSTLSQLGYMTVALGASAYSVAVFHLMTHAFFKALLFLGSGSVIHAMGGEQDMLRMGGLSKKIKWTFITMFTGTLAIAGIEGEYEGRPRTPRGGRRRARRCRGRILLCPGPADRRRSVRRIPLRRAAAGPADDGLPLGPRER